jgi:hypothetical protein
MAPGDTKAMRRAQISVFILIGVVILISIAILVLALYPSRSACYDSTVEVAVKCFSNFFPEAAIGGLKSLSPFLLKSLQIMIHCAI